MNRYGPVCVGLVLTGLSAGQLTLIMGWLERLGLGPLAAWLEVFRTGAIFGVVIFSLMLIWGLVSDLIGLIGKR